MPDDAAGQGDQRRSTREKTGTMPGSITSARSSSARRPFSHNPAPATAPLLDRQTLDRLLDRILVAPSPASSARDEVDRVCGIDRRALETEGGAQCL
jgi:hypothetical protein